MCPQQRRQFDPVLSFIYLGDVWSYESRRKKFAELLEKIDMFSDMILRLMR